MELEETVAARGQSEPVQKTKNKKSVTKQELKLGRKKKRTKKKRKKPITNEARKKPRIPSTRSFVVEVPRTTSTWSSVIEERFDMSERRDEAVASYCPPQCKFRWWLACFVHKRRRHGGRRIVCTLPVLYPYLFC